MSHCDTFMLKWGTKIVSFKFTKHGIKAKIDWISTASIHEVLKEKKIMFITVLPEKPAHRGSLFVFNWSMTTIVCVNEKSHSLITVNDKKLVLQRNGEINKISNNLRIFLWGRYEHVDSYFPHMSHLFYWLLQTHLFITLEILFSKGQKM